MKEVSPLTFGPGTWLVMHVFAMICDDEKENRKYFVFFIKKIIEKLPCQTCRKHAIEYITNNRLGENDELFRWTWQFHNSVNQRLSKPVISYEESRLLYENSNVILQMNGEDCSSCDGGADTNKEINIVQYKR